LATLATLGTFRGVQHAQAQEGEQTPGGKRISFGMVGITPGQTLRLNVVNTAFTRQGELPPDPCRVVLTFFDAEGRHYRRRDGAVVRSAAQLQPGRATSLDLNADEFATEGGRIQLRAVVTVIPPPVGDTNALPPGPCVTSVEVINNANGKTVLYVGNPGIIRGFNPQPDPPGAN
jgi:hypothetical protein